jgi:predicted aminopeptidase
LLSEIPAIKRFGEENGLKPTSNYVEYVKLDRPAAVWVVSACEPLRFESREWNFPIVGSFPFLGWFDLDDAKAFAEGMRKEGLDVDVRGAGAYSTLGWFRDAILSTMIRDGDDALGELVNVVIHESTHATLYIRAQSYFNESLANYVAGRLTPEYLGRTRGTESLEQRAYLDGEAEGEARGRKLHEAYEKLDALYKSDASDEDKRARKAEILARLKDELKFKRDLTNATLIQFKTYNVGTREFEALFRACESSWPRFFTALRKLTPDSFPKEHAIDLAPVLMPLVAAGC